MLAGCSVVYRIQPAGCPRAQTQLVNIPRLKAGPPVPNETVPIPLSKRKDVPIVPPRPPRQPYAPSGTSRPVMQPTQGPTNNLRAEDVAKSIALKRQRDAQLAALHKELKAKEAKLKATQSSTLPQQRDSKNRPAKRPRTPAEPHSEQKKTRSEQKESRTESKEPSTEMDTSTDHPPVIEPSIQSRSKRPRRIPPAPPESTRDIRRQPPVEYSELAQLQKDLLDHTRNYSLPMRR
jgi:hypothetical protein